MLPAWAIVLIAAISAAAGIAGGWLATKMRIDFDSEENVRNREHERAQQSERLKHETAEDWRDRRVRAADDFSTGVEQAILGIRAVIEFPGDREVVDEAVRLLNESVARVAGIKLLFGESSPPATVAKDLLPLLDLARLAAARPGTGAWDQLEEVYKLHTGFNRAALEIIESRDTAVSS